MIFHSDSEQLGRVFVNLIKNAIESIQEKSIDNPNFDRKIDIKSIEKHQLDHLGH